MPKGQQRKIKGAICNVPIECDDTCKILPRPPERSGIIMLKLKRKLQFRGHVYFQAVRPQLIFNALSWLKVNNPLYCNIIIDIQNISAELVNLKDDDQPVGNEVGASEGINSTVQGDAEGNNDDNEEKDDPLNEHRQATSETCLQSVLPDYPITLETNSQRSPSLGNEVYNIAPGENKHPVSIMR